MAAEALNLSSGAPTPEGRAVYLSLSNDWHSLAVTLENELGENASDAIRNAFAEEEAPPGRRRR